MKKLKTQNGITLIALVITIIVMLILVGVSVTVALNGGLFSTAKQATTKTQLELDKEQLLSAALGAINDNGEVDFAKLDANLPEGFTGSDGTYTSKSGNTYTVGNYGNVTLGSEGPTEGEGPTENTTYTIGQEIELEGENFYVIAQSVETVTLLAKYNLNTAGTAQVNATYSETACAFSSTNYWSSDPEDGLNLNTITIPAGETSVITIAKTYGEAKGGTGRLLTKDEAETLATNYGGIIYGTGIDAIDGYLYYWLASPSGNGGVWIVYGSSSGILDTYFTDSSSDGVRPVIEISKSNI